MSWPCQAFVAPFPPNNNIHATQKVLLAKDSGAHSDIVLKSRRDFLSKNLGQGLAGIALFDLIFPKDVTAEESKQRSKEEEESESDSSDSDSSDESSDSDSSDSEEEENILAKLFKTAKLKEK
mmetsp:Transcript_41301/g.54290  ORF Transcript_41301/g.54290 Transcript_41301/m.54290 type:complete len:123 (+) Transcript_41301:107-475(+)|eukprot:CAMPEP_0117754978 /NCGR_PEP_ID=MMETSP0947-20121206/13171_1 /TAXON_ID=44440 /ORGANISM="Chattonella subsalsa, Strain CCMP2191" /LENGTH=122 /DNA_ID=CAMNT_0005574211 /DNA_START=99 /DNA_END=467 /DNA_ORIENTATION=-